MYISVLPLFNLYIGYPRETNVYLMYTSVLPLFNFYIEGIYIGRGTLNSEKQHPVGPDWHSFCDHCLGHEDFVNCMISFSLTKTNNHTCTTISWKKIEITEDAKEKRLANLERLLSLKGLLFNATFYLSLQAPWNLLILDPSVAYVLLNAFSNRYNFEICNEVL